jgi:hypothetical protein
MKIEATLKAAVFVSAVASVAFSSTSARADEDETRWVDRKMSLAPLVIAIDGGLGLGHWDGGNAAAVNTAGLTPAQIALLPNVSTSGTGIGFNAEGSIGIIEHLTVGARVIGLNFSQDSKISEASGYASAYDLQNIFPLFAGGDTFNNPALWGRYQFVDMPNVEVGVEARIFVPFNEGSRFGLMGGVPVAIHLPGSFRLDTGGYVALGAYDPVLFYFHVPAQAWFNVTDSLFLGPLTALNVASFANNTTTSISLGFGVGYTVLPQLDIKVLPIYWPGINNDNGVSNFGMSAGVEYRIDQLANR